MANTAHITQTNPITLDLRHAAKAAAAWLVRQFQGPDTALLDACSDFRRADAALASTPYEDEQATGQAWAARQTLADRIATLRPTTNAGRRAKASVAVTLLQEVQPWQRDCELMFALAAFRAETGT